jgi:hypothetical protein
VICNLYVMVTWLFHVYVYYKPYWILMNFISNLNYGIFWYMEYHETYHYNWTYYLHNIIFLRFEQNICVCNQSYKKLDSLQLIFLMFKNALTRTKSIAVKNTKIPEQLKKSLSQRYHEPKAKNASGLLKPVK